LLIGEKFPAVVRARKLCQPCTHDIKRERCSGVGTKHCSLRPKKR
jgi:hypothetical protein